ncbi:MAG: Transcriptional regulator, PadR-like protein family [Candidatus Amesbacteria bacterium GW2011_GWA1_44_24]|nr:MAG: Transcriptional regulator, PadR-like protein family [Candidatus Amesbacteria bacterium GW2011_GWA1_44_24]
MIFTYMCRTCGCSFRSRDFGNIERFIEPCILLLLSMGTSHGYGLMEDLEKHCGEKVDIGNLYRTLRRMETLGWVTSDWGENKSGPDRRIYTITQEGIDSLKSATSSLIHTDKLIHRFLDGYQKNFQEDKSL